MKNRYDSASAARYDDPLDLRVYTSRLIGEDPDLVLHGGGNTSVKIDNTLYVKGSGWDLSTIEAEGFAPVDLETLLSMAALEKLSDSEMVRLQREAMRREDAPNPSIEAILHAIIPFRFVDHTHADAVVTLTNTIGGRKMIEELYGKNMLIVDYVMPGFDLAKEVYAKSRGIDWRSLDGIVLMHHGIFTFDDDAAVSYGRMIEHVDRAEKYIASRVGETVHERMEIDEDILSEAAAVVSAMRGCEVEAYPLDDRYSSSLARMEDIAEISRRGGLTPEHVIRIKPFPAIVGDDPRKGVEEFEVEYKRYFARYAAPEHIMLDPAPRWAIVKEKGIIVFAADEKERKIIGDIVSHTARAICLAQEMGGWKSLDYSQLHRMEYWELEQAKLKKKG